jgi:4-amino-4-deoxy-L-arabinose transferase-like glycosyltransferase
LLSSFINRSQLVTRWMLAIIISLSLIIKINLSRDQYLHEWDERYHALVAKNMLADPLKPTLVAQPIHEYDYKDWTLNHIWLSKPPIPLWWVALSLKCFGLNEWAVRLPGILFAQAIVLLAFAIGRSLHSHRMGLAMALLMGIHGILNDLCSGRLSSDAVETCFLFFVFLGCYVVIGFADWFMKWKGFIVVGFITGIALLCKWQPALILLVFMFLYHLPQRNIRKYLVKSTVSLLIALGLVGIWVYFCVLNYPIEMQWMLKSMFTPFVDATRNPEGQWYSYLKDFGLFFGYGSFVLLLWFIWRAFVHRSMRDFALWMWMVLPLFIFSMAEVKRGTYLFISAPPLFYLICYAWMNRDQLLPRWTRFIQLSALVSMIMMFGYSIEKLYLFRERKLTKDWSERIKNADPRPGTVIYNEPRYIEMMFYHDVTAYPFAKDDVPLLSNPSSEILHHIAH